MQLPDGRLFEYSAAGDPGAELLVFCVGTPRGQSPGDSTWPTSACPAVIIRHGDQDGFVPIEGGRWLAAHIPGARSDELAGGGHTTVSVPIDPVISDLLDAAGRR